MIQIIGRKKCRATQKAARYFQERGIKTHQVDLAAYELGERELENCARAAGGWEVLLDRSGARFAERGLAHMDFDMKEELAADSGLLRTPLVRQGKDIAVGDDEAAWKSMAAREKAGG